MKDKVYQDIHSGHFNYVQIHEDDVEYIRKEVLLEWAESMKYCGDEYTHIYVKELIDKLNSI